MLHGESGSSEFMFSVKHYWLRSSALLSVGCNRRRVRCSSRSSHVWENANIGP